jgi:hypothetical protein
VCLSQSLNLQDASPRATCFFFCNEISRDISHIKGEVLLSRPADSHWTYVLALQRSKETKITRNGLTLVNCLRQGTNHSSRQGSDQATGSHGQPFVTFETVRLLSQSLTAHINSDISRSLKRLLELSFSSFAHRQTACALRTGMEGLEHEALGCATSHRGWRSLPRSNFESKHQSSVVQEQAFSWADSPKAAFARCDRHTKRNNISRGY